MINITIKEKDGSGFPLGVDFQVPPTLGKQLKYIKEQAKKGLLIDVIIWR